MKHTNAPTIIHTKLMSIMTLPKTYNVSRTTQLRVVPTCFHLRGRRPWRL